MNGLDWSDWVEGASAQAREKQGRVHHDGVELGCIRASAGETSPTSATATASTVHPRGRRRGRNLLHLFGGYANKGASARAREKPDPGRQRSAADGCIRAGAGETRTRP